MDTVDKKILFYLLKDGRMPQRQIAKYIGISAQTLNYRINKMIEEGIIKDFIVRVTPYLYGKIEGFAAFVSDSEISDGYSSKIKCLEKITLYGFEGKDQGEVNQKIDEFSKKLGEPVMRYTPKINRTPTFQKNLDELLISQLQKMPRAKISEIAKAIDLPSIRVKRRYNFLKKMKYINVIAKVDISKTDAVLYSIFSQKQDIVAPILAENAIISITDGNAGVFVCFAENMVGARAVINTVREKEKDSDVMVIYDYEFN